MFEKMMTLQLELLLVMVIGYLLKKKNIISKEQQKGLSEILINVILPATIIKSFISNVNVTADIFSNSIIMILTCLIIQISLVFILPLLFKKYPDKVKPVMEYGLLVSNSSFVGLPVIDYIYGSKAVMYASIYLIPMRFTMWTIGLSWFAKKEKYDLKKMLLHPCILSVFIGILLMISNIKLPLFISETVSLISSSSNCISMLAIGAVLAECDLKNIFDLPTIIFTALRLIILPLSVYLVMTVLNINNLLVSIAVLLTAMPCGCTCPILAQKYNCDYKFATKLVFVSSVLSTITIPCLSFIL